MDVDSEDDQMMRAIALSLGQNVSSLESEVIPAIAAQNEHSFRVICLFIYNQIIKLIVDI